MLNFEQQETEELHEAWERFKLSLWRYLNHNMSNMEQMQKFVKGLQSQARMLLDVSAWGTIRTLTKPHVRELIEKMSLNEYRFTRKREVKAMETTSHPFGGLTLENYKALRKKLEQLNQKLAATPNYPESINQV